MHYSFAQYVILFLIKFKTRKSILKKILLILALIPLMLIASPNTMSQQRIDQITAPIALYPDTLLSQILMASTYPDEVQEAVQWLRVNSSLQGQDALQAAAYNDWDPSITALVAFPQVLDMMGRYPDWVQDIGNAFLSDPDAIMDSVQELRIQAQRNGNLTSSSKQTVITQDYQGTRTIIIQPTYSNTIYVPVYDPMQVYGNWFYPEYTPFFYRPPHFYMAPGMYIGFSLGIVVGDIMWGGLDWYHHDVYIDTPRYNAFYPHRRINANQRNISWRNEWHSNNPHIVRYTTPQTQHIIFKTNDYKPMQKGIMTNDAKPIQRGIFTNDNKPVQKAIQTNSNNPVDNTLKTNDYKPVQKNIRTTEHKSDDKNAQNHEHQSNDGSTNNNNDRSGFQHGQRNY